MKQSDITIGSSYHVRIGSRLATVVVERRVQQNRRVKFECRTDRDRLIVCTAARLRPIPASTGGVIVAPKAIGGLRVNPSRPIEQMGVFNQRGIRRFVGGVHVATSPMAIAREFCRHVNRRSLREHPVAFRRGALHCLFAELAAARSEYRQVMGHAPIPSLEMISAALLGDASARHSIMAG